MNEVVTPRLLKRWKKDGRPIVALTAYDFPTARILDEAGVDVILVGDSLGMVLMGLQDTINVTMDAMVHHTSMVARAVRRALVVADLPFLSYHLSTSHALTNAGRLMQEGGCRGVKLEGCRPELTESLVDAGIPVMGHLGLTPQSIRLTGHYRISGKSQKEHDLLVEQASIMEKAGCFSLVVECTMPDPARVMTSAISIPTIGIGSGDGCDGQILVLHDIIGLSSSPPARFARKYAAVGDEIRRAVESYAADVRERRFPTTEESYGKAK